MFKNRVRTAALAGTIALATGLSGFSAPAFAQTAQDGYNAGDGSASAPAVPVNVTEAELRDRTNATAAYLSTWQNGPALKEIVDTYIDLGSDGFDPSEQAAQAAFDQARKNATAEMAQSVKNIQAARNSVLFAKQADEKAEQDWNALVSALNAYRAEINPLIDATNKANKKDPAEFPQIAMIDEATTVNAAKVYKQIIALQGIVAGQFEKAGDWNVDVEDGNYVTREHMAALEALHNAVNARAAGIKTAYDAAVASNREAQKSDILVRQLFLERATAQRDTLRAVEAFFSVAARYVELYQNNELVGDTTLRTLYREVLEKVYAGIQFNVGILNEVDTKALAWYLVWDTDLKNNDDQNLYDEWKLEFATLTYAKIFANGAIWQEAVERVEMLDAKVKADRQAEIERLERERKQAEDLAKIADGIGKDKPSTGGSSSFKLSS